MMQIGGGMRRVALALRQGGWAVLCSAAMVLLPVAAPSLAQAAQVKRPAHTEHVQANSKTSAKRAAKGKSRVTTAKAKKSRKSRHQHQVVAESGHAEEAKFVKARRVAVDFPARPSVAVTSAPRLSVGDQLGLGETDDPLQLQSNVALVLDQDTNQVLLSKNDQAVLPIASLTKLMTGLLISEAKLPMDEPITIMPEDVDTIKHSRSRLAVGTTLTRGEMLHLALMSSENRAAHALARTYPGGLDHFIVLMNERAAALGMKDTHYVEPTGLSSDNRSSASDLAKLVATAAQDPLLRELTTSPGYEIAVGNRTLQYNNTDRLVKNPQWDIGLQKTGFINEAGDCLVMQARIAGRQLIMVFLDSANKFSRIADAERVRRWVEARAQSGTLVGESMARGAPGEG